MKYFLLFLFIVVGFLLEAKTSKVEMTGGHLDLSSYDFSNGVVEILGEANFYWESLLPDDNFKSQPTLINIGTSWNHQPEPYVSFLMSGYGTYTFTVTIPDDMVGETMILRPQHTVASAAQFFINGKQYANNGRVGKSKDDLAYVPKRLPVVQSFIPDTNILEVVIWVANFDQAKSGLTWGIFLGEETQMIAKRERSLTISLVILMTLLVMCVYHLLLFWVDKKQFVSLTFAIACLVVAVDHSLQMSMTFFQFLPNANYAFYTPLNQVIQYFIPSSFIYFLYALFPSVVSRLLARVVLLISVFATLLSLLGPTEWDNAIMFILYGFSIFLVPYSIYIGIKVHRSHEYGSKLFLLAVFILSLCAINDVLQMFELIQSVNLFAKGLAIYMFLLSILQGNRTNQLYAEKVELSEELLDLNKNLERTVQRRTEKLNNSLKDLSKVNRFQEGMANLIAHDLKSPLMQIINIDKVTNHQLATVKESGYRMLNMIQNMLDLYKFRNKRLKIDKVSIDVMTEIDKVVQEYRYFAHKKDVKVEIIQYATYVLEVDIHVFRRVISNILSNAIRYSDPGGLVQIKVQEESQSELRIGITNQGDPLPEEVKSTIFDDERHLQAVINEEYRSSGLGLSLCKLAMDELDGHIGVISEEDEDVEFWITLPGVKQINKRGKRVESIINDKPILDDEDKQYLLPFAKELENHEIFEASQIDIILAQIEPRSPAIIDWQSYMSKACFQLDQEMYNKAINLVLS